MHMSCLTEKDKGTHYQQDSLSTTKLKLAIIVCGTAFGEPVRFGSQHFERFVEARDCNDALCAWGHIQRLVLPALPAIFRHRSDSKVRHPLPNTAFLCLISNRNRLKLPIHHVVFSSCLLTCQSLPTLTDLLARIAR